MLDKIYSDKPKLNLELRSSVEQVKDFLFLELMSIVCVTGDLERGSRHP